MANRFSIDAIFRAHDKLSGIFAKIEGRVAKFGRQTARVFRDLDSANMKFAASLAKTAAVVGAAGIAAGVAIGHIGAAGADFEEAITAVGAVSLMTRDQVADLEQKALELGASTKFSATEVANAMEMMGRAGFTNAETLAGVGGILSAAAAEGAELAETASHVSNVLKGMGLAAGESGRVADVLTLASARTNSSISSLGESMKNVASTARQLGVPLEDTVAAVALLQDVGLDASEAGSAVNTMLTQMAAPSASAQAQMKALGVSFQDAKGNMLPFTEVLGQLRKSAEKSGGNMKQVAFFAELVGLRGQKAAANLQDLFAKGKVTELTKELRNAAGSAEKMAELRMQNLKGDLEQLGGAIDSVKIALFNVESGALRGIVQATTDWVGANQQLIKIKFIEFLEDGKFAIDAFAAGVRDGFKATKSGLELVLGPLEQFSDIFEGGSTWPENVKLLGEAVGVGAPLFIGYAVAVKGTTLAMGAFAVAGKVVTFVLGTNTAAAGTAAAANTTLAGSTRLATAAAWLSVAAEKGRALALGFARIATTQYTVATIRAGVATRVTALATRGWTAAVTLYTLATRRSTYATIAGTIATKAGTIVQGASNAARALATFALAQWTLGRNAATVAENAGAASAAAANLALAPLLVTLGAITAAVGALIVAWKQWESLQAAAGGHALEGVSAAVFGEGGTMGERFFNAVDQGMNRDARARAEQEQGAKPGPLMASPEERIARSVNETKSETRETAEVTIKDKTGRADMTKKPKGKVPIKLERSGAF